MSNVILRLQEITTLNFNIVSFDYFSFKKFVYKKTTKGKFFISGGDKNLLLYFFY